MGEIFWIVVAVIYIIALIVLIIQMMINAFYNIKCRKIYGCTNENCRYRGYCRKTRLTENEIADLKAMIAQLDD